MKMNNEDDIYFEEIFDVFEIEEIEKIVDKIIEKNGEEIAK